LNHYSIFKIEYFITLDDKSFYFTIILFACMVILFLTVISAFIKKISINEFDMTISFQNIITRQTKTYYFSDFDGIIDTFLNHRSGQCRTIGLVKDKKVVRYIDSFWCSNYTELRQSLNNLKCFGTLNFGAWKQMKLLLRLSIID
jgi:hypothetical protein